MISHFLLSITATLLWPYFFLLNRTEVIGRPRRILPNTLFVANHQSSLDGYLIAIAALYPRCLVRHGLMPWSLAAAEHFFRTPLHAWCSKRLQCLPVRADRGNTAALQQWMRRTKQGVGIYFPEGRRSTDGAIGRAKRGIGTVVARNRPRVIPVAIEGMHEAVRFDRFGLRFNRTIRISFGDAVDFGAESAEPGESWEPHRIADDLMGRIRQLHAPLRGSERSAPCSR